MIDECLPDVIGATNNILEIVKMLLKPRSIRKCAEAELYREKLHQEIKEMREQNLMDILSKAEEYIDSKIDEKINIDESWILNFIDASQNICDSSMQDIMSRILAKKLTKPDSISIRTLKTICELSFDECQLFSKLLSYSIRTKDGRVFIFHPIVTNEYKKNSTTYIEHLRLAECGLTTMLDDCYRIEPEEDANLIFGDHLGVIKADGNRVDSYCLSCLTTVGMEILNLLEQTLIIEYDLEFLKCAMRILKRKNNFETSIHKLVAYDVESIDYLSENLL